MPAPAPLPTIPAEAALAAETLLAREPEPSRLATADGPEGGADRAAASAPASAPAEAARPESDREALDLDRALHRAWYARLLPADPAELAAVDALVAGVRRRRRIDRLEERVLEALADGVMDSLRALAALARCRARIERDRRLLLEELSLLRDPARLPLRAPRPRRSVERASAAARHTAPEPDPATPAAVDPHRAAPAASAPADRPAVPARSSKPARTGMAPTHARTTETRGLAGSTPPRHEAPEPRSAGRLGGPFPPVAVAPDPLARAVAEAFPSPRRDFHRLPDWRDRTSAFALEVGRLAAGCGRG